MISAKNTLRLSVAALAISFAAPVAASEFSISRENAGVEVGVSTLGTFVAPTYDLTRTCLAARARAFRQL